MTSSVHKHTVSGKATSTNAAGTVGADLDALAKVVAELSAKAHVHEQTPDAPPPVPPTSSALFDTARDGWAAFKPIYVQKSGTAAYDPGDKQDADYGLSMAHVSVDAQNVLTVSVRREAGGFLDSNTGTRRPFFGAAIGTKDAFAFGPSANGTRCTFRAKWDAVQGAFHALWYLEQGRNQSPPEVDAPEAVTGTRNGNGPALATLTNHTSTGPEVNPSTGLTYLAAPASLVGLSTWAGTWHDWSKTLYPDRIEYHVDGKLIGVHRKVPAPKMYPIIEAGAGGPAYQIPPTSYRTDAATPNFTLQVARVWVEQL